MSNANIDQIFPSGDAQNWHGVHNQFEHRTVGVHRAWCHVCTMWCYPGLPAPDHNCDCCLEAEGYVRTWLTPSGDTQQ